MKKIMALLLCLLLLSGCGMTITYGELEMKPAECAGTGTVILDTGVVVKCLDENSMYLYYQAQQKKTSKQATLDAIVATKGDAAAQVALAYESKKNDGELKLRKTWDQRLLPYWNSLGRIANPFGNAFSGGSDNEKTEVRIVGDGNEFNMGNETIFGRDGVQQDTGYLTKPNTEYSLTGGSGGYQGWPTVTNNEPGE